VACDCRLIENGLFVENDLHRCNLPQKANHMTIPSAALPEREPIAPLGPAFTARDIFRDRATTLRFGAILGFIMGQVFPAAFYGLMLPAIYREKGLSLDMFWIFALPAIPTWLRPLWAPLVDGVGSTRLGMRKTWIIPCTLFGAAAYLAIGFVEPTLDAIWMIIGLLILKAAFMTTQDIAIDGYMVENLRDEERGVGAAVIDIGRNIAQFGSWAGIAWVYGAYGWHAAATVAAALLVLFSIPGVIRNEPPQPAQALARRARGERPSLLKLLKREDTRYVLPLIVLVSFAGSLIATLFVPFLVDKGFTIGQIGPLVFAPATLIGTLIGASATAWFLNRFGYKKTILVAAFLMIPTVIPIIWLGSLEKPSLLVVFLVTLNGTILPSFLQVAMAASRLKWASKTQAATDYTAAIVAAAASVSAALAIGGVIAEHVGWHAYFAFGGIFTIVACFVFYVLFDRIESIVEERDRREVLARDH
jgi:MFS family permease